MTEIALLRSVCDPGLPGGRRPCALAALCALVLGLWSLAGCGGSQRPRPARELQVAGVRVEGNKSIGADTLVEGLALTRASETGQEFDPYLVRRDTERVRGFYLRKGFFRVLVRSRVSQRKNRVIVTFVIEEGPRSRLARVEMTGLPDDPKVSRQQLREQIDLDDGEPFDYEPYDLAKPKLVAALEAAGYAHARLEGTVAADTVRNEAIVRLELQPGPLCRFGPIQLSGAAGELGNAAKARIAAREGMRFSTEALADTQAALYEMGRFAVVRIEPDRTGGAAVVPVAITVIESPRHELRLGGGLGVNPAFYEIRGRAGYQIAGWPRPLVTTRLELKPAYILTREEQNAEPRIEAIASLERLDLFRPLLRAEIEASFAYLAVEAYTSVGPRLRFGLRAPVYKQKVYVAAGWQLRVLDFSKIDDAITPELKKELGLDGAYVLGFYEQSLVVDLRDNPVEPRRGIYGELRFEEGTPAALGEFDYVRVGPEVRSYLPLGRLVLATRGRVGAIIGDLPVTQRYFAGGASSQRGFPERRLAPTATRVVDGAEKSVVIGGGGLVEVGAELRRPIGSLRSFEFGGVLFLDGADVAQRLDGIDPTDLHWAVGAGLRMKTVVGPVRFDVGYRLNRTGADEPWGGHHFAYHLSLGEAF